MAFAARNILIGLIDGLTIPFALAAGLSNIVHSSQRIFWICVTIIIAYGLTMTGGAYMSAKEHEAGNAWHAAATIGISYVAGGLLSVWPFYLAEPPWRALQYAAAITLLMLCAGGYAESKLHAANGWTGALRVGLTGMLVGAAAYGVAFLFG